MSTITKERAKDILEFGAGRIISPITDDEIMELARIALASLEAKSRKLFTCSGCGAEGLDEPLESKCHCNEDGAHWVESVVYTAPPAPVADCNSPAIPDGWESCKHLLPIGELIHRLEEQTGEKWIYAKDAIPDGYVMVPVEPTEKMVIEGFESEPDEFFSKSEVWEAYQEMSGCQQAAHRAKLCWSAMLAAAPKPEA
ncbi:MULTISPECIES: hypothetical protein [Enterobacter cloacae complex]|uniref:hypothetical protein n=1 Tax=Enterobacter cloacae complex TaxID=354276 RepID=UPI001D059F4A|nr:hypothetical protein [Enterobacter cloacae complex sp. S4]